MIRRSIAKVLSVYKKYVDPALFVELHPYYDLVDHEGYDEIYDRGLSLTNTKAGTGRRDRFYNLYKAIDVTEQIPGVIAECGVFKGHSSYIICSRLKGKNSSFDGRNYFVVDSFEGLSQPTEKDKGEALTMRGKMRSQIDEVKLALNEFPRISYFKGFIPDVFTDLPEEKYRFVHVDVDLAEPTLAAFEYFFPRLNSGGMMISDDYGFMLWAGTKTVVDYFLNGVKDQCFAIPLNTGQIIVIKK